MHQYPTVLQVYNRNDLEFDYGKGCYLFDKSGRKYLDFASGFGVTALGHSHPKLVKALTMQAKKLWHTSNMFTATGLNELSQKLVDHSFADTVFFCNSGAESIECGIKMIRKYNAENDSGRYRIITFKGAFHGRTFGAISASAPGKVSVGYQPLLDGFDNVEFNNIEAVKAAITDKTAAILIEPIQGDGGINEANAGFIKDLRKLCDQHKLILFFDEVQCGMGRSGSLFAYENYGIEPDIMALAKGIGGGFPLAACLARGKIAAAMQPGTHGSTYGSNPLAMAAGGAVIDVMLANKLPENARRVGVILKRKLTKLAKIFPGIITEVRGLGLMLGIKTLPENKFVVEKLLAAGLITAAAGDNVVRILPPLITRPKQVNEAIAMMEKTFVDFDK